MFYVVSTAFSVEIHCTTSQTALSDSSVFPAGSPVRILNKCFIDYIFIRSLEVACRFDLPMQIHTG